MSQTAVIKLVHSLSKSEKRRFILYTKRHAGDKVYLGLFHLIEHNQITDKDLLLKNFRKLYPDASLDNTARYLLKVLLDSLIQSQANEEMYQLMYGLLRLNVLKERNLQEEVFKELNRLQDLSAGSENPVIQYFIYRERLNYLSNNNFQNYSENNLVTLQMKTRDVLKDIRNTQEHYSLYELLKYRLTHSGKILSEEGKRKLNDLLLSEMSIVNARVRHNLESRKLHLLFQSFFFTNIGDYRSALKTFHELNRLFEKNTRLWGNPPLDYFAALDGILDSLRTNGYFKEMPFYIEKLKFLNHPAYPEYFCFLVDKTVMIYQLANLINEHNFDAAIELIHTQSRELSQAYKLVDEEKQNELLFYLALSWFYKKKYKNAQKFLNEIVLVGKVNHYSVTYKAARILSMLISYEDKKLDYLDYEIRSYKRILQGKSKLLKTEKLIFKVIKMNPDFNGRHKNQILWKSLDATIKSIERDKFENQLLKFIDLIGWVRNKFGMEE